MRNALLEVTPVIPDALSRLPELAGNLFFSWHRPTRALFEDLDRGAVEAGGRQSAPASFAASSQKALNHAAEDADLSRALQPGAESLRRLPLGAAAVRRCAARRVLLRGVWISRELPDLFRRPRRSRRRPLQGRQRRAHEFHRGRPALRAGLLHADRRQRRRPARRVLTSTTRATCRSSRCDGRTENWLKVSVRIAGRDVHARIWKAHVGRIAVYLLDTNCPENAPADRDITHRLYGGDESTRIRQEMILGIGGTRALRALGLQPAVWHLNEGHASFLILELLREHVARGLPFNAALEAVAAQCVFTTHTPVAAGHDAFGHDLIVSHFGDFIRELGLPLERFLELGRAPSVSGPLQHDAARAERHAPRQWREPHPRRRVLAPLRRPVARDPAGRESGRASSRTAFTCRRSCIRPGQSLFDRSLARRLARTPARADVLARDRAPSGRAVLGTRRSP